MTQSALDFTAPVSVYAQHRAEVGQEQRRTEAAMWRILARLQQGPATTVELCAIALRATGRMSDLRLHHGYQIEKAAIGGGQFVYTLIREPGGER
jgi:hypothetical protein